MRSAWLGSLQRLIAVVIVGLVLLVGCAGAEESPASEEGQPVATTTSLDEAAAETGEPPVPVPVGGVDDLEELRKVLVADSRAGGYGPAQDRCIVDAVLDTLGVDRLAEIGVTVESPEFVGQQYRLTDEENEAVLDAMGGCDLRSRWRAAYLEERTEACVLGRITPDEEWAAVEYDLTGVSADALTPIWEAEVACADEAVEQIYDLPGDVSPTVAAVAEELVGWLGPFDVFEERCFVTGVGATLTAEEVDPYLRWEGGEDLSGEALQGLFDYQLQIEDVATTCLEPFTRLQNLLWEADVAAVDTGCLRYELDDERLRQTTAVYGPGVWGGDSAARAKLARGLAEVGEVLGLCDNEDRGYQERWETYIGQLT